MKHSTLFIIFLVSSTICFGQDIDITLTSPESGTKTHQARNSITFAPNYSYTPNGGTMTAEIVNPLTIPEITGDIVFNSAIDPSSYNINTSLDVGKTPGALNVGGSASYTIPLDVPKGTGGMQPAISLNYVSSFMDGSLGFGWNISGLSAITRVNKTIYHDNKSDAIRGDLTDKYALDGNRLIKISGTYGYANSEYRTEMDQFSKIVAYGSTNYGPEWFKVYTKSGLIYEYGNSDNSKIKKNNGCVLSWKLNKIYDRYDNYITFIYLDTDDEHPIGFIEYTGNSSQGQIPFASLVFNYKNRSDVSNYCYGGIEFSRNILLDNIEVKNNGQIYKKYEMIFAQDTHAQLIKVTEKTGTASFNPTVFAWTDQTEQYTQTTHYSNSSNENYFHGDFNGDGRTDFVTVPDKTSYTSSDKWKLYLANSNGIMEFETQGSLNSNFETFIEGDFNGDGLADLMMQQNYYSSYWPNRKKYYLYESIGNNFTRSSSYHYCNNPERLDIIDYNGDGKLEFLYHDTHDPTNNWFLYTYSGQLIYNSFIPSFGDYYIIDNGMHNRIIDFNGDGCSDLLVLFSNSYKVYEFKGTNNRLIETHSGYNIENNDFLLFGDYNGDGTTDIIKEENTSGANWSMLHLTDNGFAEHDLSCFDDFSINISNNRIYAREMNGDGKTDVVLVGKGVNTYNSFNRINIAISTGSDFNITEHLSSTTMQYYPEKNFNFGDYNGDGRNQLFYKYHSTSKLYSFATGTPSHLISDIIDGFGARTEITYLPMSNSTVYTRGTGATYPVIDFSSAMQLVSRVDADNGIGGTASMTYKYEGAKIHRKGKGFLGFSKVTATNEETGINTESNYDFDETYFYPQLTTVYTKKGSTSILTVSNTWIETSFGNKRIFPYISSTTQTDDLKGLSVTTTASYNSYGNPTSVAKDFGGGHTQTTTYQYNDEKTNIWLIGRPTNITSTAVKGSETDTYTITRTYFSWNNSPDIEQNNSGDQAYWKFDRDYDDYGNLWKGHKETSGLSKLTTVYNYDTKGVHLTKITYPTGDDIDYTYYSTSGLLNTKTDHFGNMVTNSYSNTYQLTGITPAGGISATITSGFDTSGGPAHARYYVKKTGSDGSEIKKWYDKLGRELRNEVMKFGGTMVKTDMQYNSKGQMYHVSEPTTGTPSCWNTTTFDDYGQAITIDPYFGATTTIGYNGATTTSTVNSRNYTAVVNSTGQTTERTDPGGTITFNYYPNGTLESTVAPGGTTTSMTYDKNGNRLTITDPSAGTITNTYYGTGQLKTTTSARDSTTTYYYQSNGLLDRYVLEEGEVNYTYNADNQVSSITSPGGVTRTFTYDAKGRTSTVTELVGTESNIVTFVYDTKGRLSKKYFNGPTAYEEYGYDANSGYLYQIKFNGTTVWQLTGMDKYGRITNANIGSNPCTWGYDSNEMLEQIKATGVQQYDYSFNTNTGNLNSRTNFNKSLAENFTYDNNLDRLTGVSGNSTLTMDYLNNNNNGNINYKSDAGTYKYETTGKPYAISEISNGKNIDTTRQYIKYYSFEKVKKITQGTKTADFIYNCDNQRIKMELKNNGTTTKTRYYFGSSCEREVVDIATTQYIWIGGSAYTAVAVAKKTGSGGWTVYNIFRDHLGTITHLKNVSTGMVTEYSLDAWGRRRNATNWGYVLDSNDKDLFAGRGFTAHEHLEDFNLVNMNGRVYDPVVGRFLSPDPHVQMPDFTQNFNRYSYALNNPLIYTDPSGEKWKWPKFKLSHLIPVFGQLQYIMEMINDNTVELRQNMVDAGVPDFNIGINSGGNTFHSINGYRVDHNQFGGSNANAVVNKAINNMQNNYFSQQHYQASYSQNLSNSIASYEQSSVAQASVGAFGNTISGVGFAGSVASNVDGTFRLLKSGSISLGYYTSGWIKGNQYVKNLYSVSKVGTRVSTGVSIITTGIAYNEIIKGDRSPFNYADATVGTIGLSSSAVSYFRGSRIPGVGFFIAIYGAGRLGWDVGASLAYKYGPINGTYWHGNKNREYYGY